MPASKCLYIYTFIASILQQGNDEEKNLHVSLILMTISFYRTFPTLVLYPILLYLSIHLCLHAYTHNIFCKHACLQANVCIFIHLLRLSYSKGMTRKRFCTSVWYSWRYPSTVPFRPLSDMIYALVWIRLYVCRNAQRMYLIIHIIHNLETFPFWCSTLRNLHAHSFPRKKYICACFLTCWRGIMVLFEGNSS